MRELIGYLVARGGAERAVARMAVGIHQRILCEQFLCEQFPCEQFPGKEGRARRARAMIGDESVGTDIAFVRISIGDTDALTENVPTVSAPTGTPITNIYAREKIPRDAIAEIAGALPGFGTLD